MKSFARHQKLLCFLLVLSLLFFGVREMHTQADSVSMYGIIHHTDSVLHDPGFSSPAEQLCNESTFRLDSEAALLRQTTSRITNRTIRAFFCLLFFVELLSMTVPTVLACNLLAYNKVTSCSHTIVRYLHRKDGKKSI